MFAGIFCGGIWWLEAPSHCETRCWPLKWEGVRFLVILYGYLIFHLHKGKCRKEVQARELCRRLFLNLAFLQSVKKIVPHTVHAKLFAEIGKGGAVTIWTAFKSGTTLVLLKSWLGKFRPKMVPAEVFRRL